MEGVTMPANTADRFDPYGYDRFGGVINNDPGAKNRVDGNTDAGTKQKKVEGLEECQTCKNRRYQDGSDDPGVSFKTPTKMSPGEAASKVAGHEREHYSREAANAKEDGREVVSNDIRIFTDVCPECGKVYVSGGETRTVTRKKQEQAQFAKQFYDEKVGVHYPKEIDVEA